MRGGGAAGRGKPGPLRAYSPRSPFSIARVGQNRVNIRLDLCKIRPFSDPADVWGYRSVGQVHRKRTGLDTSSRLRACASVYVPQAARTSLHLPAWFTAYWIADTQRLACYNHRYRLLSELRNRSGSRR